MTLTSDRTHQKAARDLGDLDAAMVALIAVTAGRHLRK